MKKIILLLLICFTFSFNSHAQLFSEDFGAGSSWQSSWPTGWEQIDEDGSGGLVWFGNGGTMSSFSWDGVTQFFPNHYAVSPPINVTGSNGLFLDYKAGGKSVGFSAEVFTVYVSTGFTVPDFLGMTAATTVSSGIIDLADHFPDANGGLADFTLDISALDGATTIYIAYRHHDTPINQNMLQIDDVVVTATLGIDDNVFAGFNIFVDSRNVLQLSTSNKTLDGITIYNLLGQNVLYDKLSSTKASINLSGLHSGVYIAQVNIDGILNSFKILKN